MPRDTTVTRENAYNNLFLDSATVDVFLKSIPEGGRNNILNFYNGRNYEFAWFNDNGLVVQAEGFWDVHNNYLLQSADSSFFDVELHDVMDTLLYADSIPQLGREVLIQTELLLTKHFFEYIQIAFGPSANPKELQWHIPKRKLNIAAMLDSLQASGSKDWQPLNPAFHRLQKAIFRYSLMKKENTWPLLETSKKKWRKGSNASFVKAVKRRLNFEGYYNPHDTSSVFSDSLERTIMRIQINYGMRPTGTIDQLLVEELNVPIDLRIKQMLVNLERMKWMPREPEDYITINIPEYRFRVIEGGNEALSMNVVVGKTANRTVIFSDELQYIVFSPYWNIPRSIVRNEIAPALKRSSSYLRRNNMEITGYSGGLPIIRQKPGRGNALGKVKFLFPNNYNIYFHDTPAKSLFGRDKRAFSHGCIRLEHPFSLARHLLQNDSSWTDALIRKAMNRNREKWVKLETTWPVFITYFTSWADKYGQVHFLEDIYGHDEKLQAQLF